MDGSLAHAHNPCQLGIGVGELFDRLFGWLFGWLGLQCLMIIAESSQTHRGLVQVERIELMVPLLDHQGLVLARLLAGSNIGSLQNH